MRMSPVRSPQAPQRTLERRAGIGIVGGSLKRSRSEDRLQRQQTAVIAKSGEKAARVFMAGSVRQSAYVPEYRWTRNQARHCYCRIFLHLALPEQRFIRAARANSLSLLGFSIPV
jgi:hypothetical protein